MDRPAFLDYKLVIEGLTPVPAPASSPTASGVAAVVLEDIKAEPLKQLRVDELGNLIIPSEEELADHPPVTLTEEITTFFQDLRSSHPSRHGPNHGTGP